MLKAEQLGGDEDKDQDQVFSLIFWNNFFFQFLVSFHQKQDLY